MHPESFATHNLCDFWLTPIGGERARYGWLSGAALSVGKILDFTVKPGRYKMTFYACQNWWSAAAGFASSAHLAMAAREHFGIRPSDVRSRRTRVAIRATY